MTYSEKHEEYEDKFRLITAKFDGEIYNQNATTYVSADIYWNDQGVIASLMNFLNKIDGTYGLNSLIDKTKTVCDKYGYFDNTSQNCGYIKERSNVFCTDYQKIIESVKAFSNEVYEELKTNFEDKEKRYEELKSEIETDLANFNTQIGKYNGAQADIKELNWLKNNFNNGNGVSDAEYTRRLSELKGERAEAQNKIQNCIASYDSGASKITKLNECVTAMSEYLEQGLKKGKFTSFADIKGSSTVAGPQMDLM